MGYRPLRTLTQIHTQGYRLLVTCACGHRALADALPLAQLAQRRRVPPTLASIGQLARCSACGSRAYTAELVTGELEPDDSPAGRARVRAQLRG